MKKYENGTDHISKDLRLRKRYMLSSHMSYHQLFEDFIPKSQYHNRHLYPVPIELFEKVLAVEDGLWIPSLFEKNYYIFDNYITVCPFIWILGLDLII